MGLNNIKLSDAIRKMKAIREHALVRVEPVRENGCSLFPASIVQERFWFIQQTSPAAPVWNIAIPFRLTGMLDRNALKQSLTYLFYRHDAFRTTFHWRGGQLFQQVHPDGILPYIELDLRGTADAYGQGIEALRQEMLREMDLSSGPLMRVMLVILTDDQYLLQILTNHLTFDGWSQGILLQELSQVYATYSQGAAPDLPPPPVEYGDFAVWQRKRQQDGLLDGHLPFWKTYLENAPTITTIPLDEQRPKEKALHGQTVQEHLSRPISDAVRQFAREERITLYAFFLAAYAALLSRYTGQNDLVVGVTTAGREQSEVEHVIGCFVNVIPVRIRVDPAASFLDLVRQVRDSSLEAISHQETPLEDIVAALHLQGSPNTNPLFQTFFVHQNSGGSDALCLAGLSAEFLSASADTGFKKTDVVLQTYETEPLEVSVDFHTDLYQPAKIQRFLAHYQRMIAQVCQTPTAPLSELSYLLDSERDTVLHRFPIHAFGPSSPAQDVVSLIAQQAQYCPDHPACLEQNGRMISYRELDLLTDQLADFLIRQGIQPQDRVGVLLPRTANAVVALLGILKARAVYLPLDMQQPKARKTFVLQDGGARAVLTQRADVDAVREFYSGAIYCLDEVPPQVEPVTRTPPSLSDAAYVIYTSGSTGKPKGVVIEHKGIANLAYEMIHHFQLGPDSRYLHASSLAFDASIMEFFPILVAGGTLCLPAAQKILPSWELVNALNQMGVTTMILTPSVLRLIPTNQIPSLKTVITGAEACTEDIVAAWGVDYRLINAYGPTEATVCVTMSDPLRPGDPISIGRPLRNAPIYLLDQHGQPVPVGIPGELYIGGIGLAREYLNRPDLTAEKFVERLGTRLYRSGDIAVWNEDGTIRYLGRIDNSQIKIRGNRIEIDEIENVLRQMEGISDAAVLLNQEKNGLAAFYVSSQIGNTQEIFAYLKQHLPDYMIPGRYIRMEQLPVNSSGKLNRELLREQLAALTDREHSAAPQIGPRNSLERELAAIWCELLNLESVGVQDSFFMLGGHSLLLVQLSLRIKQQFEIDIPLHLLFSASTIETQAQEILAQYILATDSRILLELL